MIRCIFLISLCFSFLQPLTSGHVTWTTGQKQQNIGNCVSILKDKAGIYTLQEVMADSLQKKFRKSEKIILNFGFNTSSYWLHFDLDAPTDSLILELAHATLEHVEFYAVDSAGNAEMIRGGYHIPLDQKFKRHHFQIFPLFTGKYQYYIKISPPVHPLPIRIHTVDHFENITYRQRLVFGFYLGLMFFVILSNLFFYISLRNKLFLFYSGIVVIYLVYASLVMDGFVVYFIDHLDLLFWYKNFPILGVPMQMMYALVFLEMSKYSPRLSKYTWWLIYYFIAYAILTFFIPLKALLAMNTLHVLISFFGMCYLGYQAGKKGNSLGKPFGIAYLIYFMLALVEATYIQIGKPGYLMELSHVAWATLIEAFILSFLLSKRFEWERDETNRIRELDEAKTKLYANITHEFRTPLTVILGITNQLRTNPSANLNVALDMITRNGENLLNLVNQMLDLAKLESGKMTIQLIKGDFISFLRYIMESFQSLAVSQHKQLHFLPEQDEIIVAFDPGKVGQILSNLLSNALKFTPEGGNVYVSLGIEENPGKENIILILKVIDTGIGISEENIPHVFDRFYQADNSHTRSAEGNGIGLALTKELVKLLKGTITVKSPPAGATKGTEFLITLPLSRSDDDKIEPFEFKPYVADITRGKAEFTLQSEKKQAIDKTDSRSLILLVEDNADVVAYIAACLPDYALAVGNNGREGFEIATNIIPDLIITDVMMPIIDGFEMCRSLREDERTSHIPIIMLTAKADMSSILEGLHTGADVYLQKPFHKEELLLHIRRLIEQRKKLRDYYTRQLGLADQDKKDSPAETETVTPNQTEHAFVTKVRDIVEANFSNYTFNVDQLCKSVFMSHSQLHRKMEVLTGLSPNQFIRSVRLKKAKELILQNNLSISLIAMECGYNDPGYFSRVFRQETGYSPQEWRNKQIQSS